MKAAHQALFGTIVVMVILAICWPAFNQVKAPLSPTLTTSKVTLVKQCVLEGQALFNEHCTACHKLHYGDNFPKLAEAIGFEPYNDYLVDFLLRPDSMVNHNSYAKKVFEVFHSSQRPFLHILTPTEIKEIEAYIIFEDKVYNMQGRKVNLTSASFQ